MQTHSQCERIQWSSAHEEKVSPCAQYAALCATLLPTVIALETLGEAEAGENKENATLLAVEIALRVDIAFNCTGLKWR